MIFSSNPVSFLLTSYFKNRLIRLNLFFSLLVNFCLWLFLIWRVKTLSSFIFLHYNIYFGIDQLGSRNGIFILPALGLGFLIINFILARLTYSEEKNLSYFLAAASSFIQVILVLAGVLIISINH